jgi:hypothetical protein
MRSYEIWPRRRRLRNNRGNRGLVCGGVAFGVADNPTRVTAGQRPRTQCQVLNKWCQALGGGTARGFGARHSIWVLHVRALEQVHGVEGCGNGRSGCSGWFCGAKRAFCESLLVPGTLLPWLLVPGTLLPCSPGACTVRSGVRHAKGGRGSEWCWELWAQVSNSKPASD